MAIGQEPSIGAFTHYDYDNYVGSLRFNFSLFFHVRKCKKSGCFLEESQL